MGASLHIDAQIGDIAETILLPGDPLRAKFIAENFFENAECFNKTRNMFGYTGTYKGEKISVMGTGMGMPSIAIYSHELIDVYGCKNLIRIGSAGSYQADIELKDLVLATASSTDSNFQYTFDLPGYYSPSADFDLILAAKKSADKNGIKVKAGNVLSADVFYDDDPDTWKRWAKMGVLAVEMESAALYLNAARYGAKALTMVTISDNFVTGGRLSNEEREKSFTDMMTVALGMSEFI
ncbi:MAG: purine-nucleoside phosphorylase [Firmicutes bacterium]|nr:purine-nucleoside phosphorylase [Bacillota bacterium]